MEGRRDIFATEAQRHKEHDGAQRISRLWMVLKHEVTMDHVFIISDCLMGRNISPLTIGGILERVRRQN